MDNTIKPGSVPSFRSELDIFKIPPTDISLISSDFQAYYPLTNVKENENPLEFHINGNSNHYLDLFSSYLYLKVKILKQNGSSLSANDTVAPGNLFFSTLFQNCYVALNGTQIADSANFYPYQAYLVKQLGYGYGLKTSEMTNELYYKDSKAEDFTAATNPGFEKRLKIALQSKPFEMIGKIFSSIFLQRRYLPTNVDVTVVLRRSPPEFALSCNNTSEAGVTGTPWKIKIEDAVLYVRKHLINPQILKSHQSLFGSGRRAVYPIKRIDVKSICLPTGSLGTSGEVLFNGTLPEILTIGLVSTKAVSGALNKNPFNFHHFNLSNIGITVDNDTAVYRALNFDFANQQYLQGYNTLFRAVGHENEGNYLERGDYVEGNTLIVFDLQPSNSGARYQLERTGQVKIELKFADALAAPVNIIAFAQFQSTIQIDNNRNIILDIHG